MGEEKKKKKSFLRGNPSRPDPFLLESSSADTGHRYQISPVDSQLGLTYDPCGSTLNENTLERDVDHSSAYCDSLLRHPQSAPFEVLLCLLLPNLQSFMGTEVGSPNITRQKDLNESGSRGNSKFRSVHSSLYHHCVFIVYTNVLSHDFNRALSEFLNLNQFLAR